MALIIGSTNNALSYKLIGIAMSIHNELGPGLKEQVYQSAFEEELKRHKIYFEPQKQIEIYSGMRRIGLLFIDLFVNERIVVELKALSHQLTMVEIAQVISYLKVMGCGIGLLFNFGRKYLEYKRIFLPKKITEFNTRDLQYMVRRSTNVTTNQRIGGQTNKGEGRSTNARTNERILSKNETTNHRIGGQMDRGDGQSFTNIGTNIGSSLLNKDAKYKIVIR